MNDARPARARRWFERPLAQVTLIRYREFLREPEAVFWVFVFPILLATGLGVAFRNRPQETVKVGVVASAPGAPAAMAALKAEKSLEPVLLDDSAAQRELSTGAVALLISPVSAAQATYRSDDTRPESRAARMLTDSALQRAAGRVDAVAVQDSTVHDLGARYIDFVIPGLLGMNLMGSGIWGVGFAIVDARKKLSLIHI